MKLRVALKVLIILAVASIANAAAPDAPQALTASVSGNTVTITFAPATSGDAATGYLVVAALSPAGAPIAALPVSGTSLVVPNVPNGIYYVHVRAVNVDGVSGASNEAIVAVPGGVAGCSTPPVAPVNVTANVAGTGVTLQWGPVAGACAATGYVVQAGSSPGSSDIAVINVGGATSLTATAPPGTYYVRVIALNAAGASAASREIVVAVGPPAAREVTIEFGGLAGGANREPIATYSESGFTLATTAQDWMTLTTYGNPAPFIQFLRDASQATQVGEVTVTAGGLTFAFESVDVYSSTTPIPYEIVGLRGGATVFTLSGTVPNTFGRFATINTSQPDAAIDTLLIRLTNPTTGGPNPVGFDNLVLRQ